MLCTRNTMLFRILISQHIRYATLEIGTWYYFIGCHIIASIGRMHECWCIAADMSYTCMYNIYQHPRTYFTLISYVCPVELRSRTTWGDDGVVAIGQFTQFSGLNKNKYCIHYSHQAGLQPFEVQTWNLLRNRGPKLLRDAWIGDLIEDGQELYENILVILIFNHLRFKDRRLLLYFRHFLEITFRCDSTVS